MIYTQEIGIEEIKTICIDKFKYQEKNKNNIILYFVDEDEDKNIINNFDELFNFAKEVGENNLSINLFSELKAKEKNNINDLDKNKKINDNGVNTVNGYMNNNNKDNIIYIKDKEIEELKNENYNLKKKNEHDFERYKNILFYYEEFIKPTRNEKEEENNKKNENEKKENKIKEIENNENENNIKNNENEKIEKNAKDKENNIIKKKYNIKNIENDKNENDNKINNEFKENKIDKSYNSILKVSNEIIDLQFSKTFKQDKTKGDIIDDKLQNNKNVKSENEIKFKEIEFINEKCSLCHKRSEDKIYKDYKENKSYLCEYCYNKNKKIYKDNVFEIKFPKKLLDIIKERKIKRKELGNRPILDFNNFLNNIFFDNEGNFSLKEIKE